MHIRPTLYSRTDLQHPLKYLLILLKASATLPKPFKKTIVGFSALPQLKTLSLFS